MILIIGAALLVVQLALDMINSEPSKMCSLTPKTTVLISGTSAGADRITRWAPAVMCWLSSWYVLNFPVASMTKSGAACFQGMSAMFF